MNIVAPFSSLRPVIIGTGLAGLTTALSLEPMPAILVSAAALGDQTSSILAQGGIAAALGAGDASRLHAEDTIKAGGGLCDPGIARLVTADAAAIIENLITLGVAFDRDAGGRLQLGLEGAHGARRVVHANGDGTGRAIMKALIAAVRRTPSITVIENAVATDLLTDTSGIAGVAFMQGGERQVIATTCVILATGGAGGLWRHTTNPAGSWGWGLALAARAGADLADLEFMQFHPTAIDLHRDPMPLASEALRGEGAVLIDENGERFMKDFPRTELEPRDVVARAIWAHMEKGHKIFLDARAALGKNFAARFPAVHAICVAAGIEPATMPIPVRPAAHYHMGGVKTDAMGRSSLDGLWACGEVAATGLHGANRLASNSLLEAASFGRRVAEDIKGVGGHGSGVRGKTLQRAQYRSLSVADKEEAQKIRDIMSAHVGLVRDGNGLTEAVEYLAPLAADSDMALAALMIAVAALRREESRGSHSRADYPAASAAFAQSRILSLDDICDYAQALGRLHSRPVRAGT